MATKLARMVIYLFRLLIINSYKTLTTWCCKVTRQNYFIFLLQECLWETNLAEWWLLLMSFYLYCHMTLWSMWPCKARGSLKAGGSPRKHWLWQGEIKLRKRESSTKKKIKKKKIAPIKVASVIMRYLI